MNTAKIDFRQLQELTNRWTNELEEQEKLFIQQAVKLNYWDRALMVNGEKITKLSEVLNKVKVDNKKLEENMEEVKQIQRKVETFVEALEASTPRALTIIPERASMYARIENVDIQLQQMAEDLREIVGHINDSNKVLDKTDHVSQILKILNEHTDTLQWINDHVEALKEKMKESPS